MSWQAFAPPATGQAPPARLPSATPLNNMSWQHLHPSCACLETPPTHLCVLGWLLARPVLCKPVHAVRQQVRLVQRLHVLRWCRNFGWKGLCGRGVLCRDGRPVQALVVIPHPTVVVHLVGLHDDQVGHLRGRHKRGVLSVEQVPCPSSLSSPGTAICMQGRSRKVLRSCP